jgi:hypothetical protein
MATYQKFNAFVENQTIAKIDWDSDVFKVMLTNTAPNGTTGAVKADITEISAGNGYTAGGATTTVTTSRTTGTQTVNGTQVVFTAAGGTMAAFRYAVLYDDTIATPAKPLVAFWDYGSSVTLNDTETFTIKFNNASPGAIFTLA